MHNASLHTSVAAARRSHSHVAHAGCMVLESYAACVQILEGLSCNRRAEVSGTPLTQERSSLVNVHVLEQQERRQQSLRAAATCSHHVWRVCRARSRGAPRDGSPVFAHGRLRLEHVSCSMLGPYSVRLPPPGGCRYCSSLQRPGLTPGPAAVPLPRAPGPEACRDILAPSQLGHDGKSTLDIDQAVKLSLRRVESHIFCSV